MTDAIHTKGELLMRRSQAVLIAALAALGFTATPTKAQEVINLTIGASHPVTIPWVNVMQTFVVPESNRRLQEQGNKYRINWREAYGGQLYKANATLTSVGEGIADLGWVFHTLEGAKMPLNQVAVYAPGVTNDPKLLCDIFNDLNASLPALKAEWDRNNVIYLGGTCGDTHQTWTKFPLRSIDDLKGRKISAAGVLGAWLRGTGAVAVDGSLPTFYTDLKTGVSDGALSVATGMIAIKIHEVAPYVTRVNLGSNYFGGLAVNKDTYAKLPPPVQTLFVQLGREYSARVSAMVNERHVLALKQMVELGAGQTPPVTVADWSEAERLRWFNAMPNIAQDWVKANEARGLPAGQVLSVYMNAARERGAKPIRNWDK
jgi:TRAP-type C4-dicarboxylate transport system substrate-binding protein